MEAGKLFKRLLIIVMAASLVAFAPLSAFAKSSGTADAELEVGGNDDVGILEQDDFETLEEYQRYLENNPQFASAVRAIKDASPKKESNAAATLRCRIVGLVDDHAVQKAYIGSKYIYALQRDGSDAYLSRCLIDGKTATCKDRMTLKNFGHGQTLEWFEHNGEAYFWVTCKADPTYNDKKMWGIQLGRLQYSADADDEPPISYTDIPRFSSMSSANAEGKSIGKVKRVDAALSSDKGAVLFWVMDDTGEVQYSLYDADKLNAALDAKEGKASKYVPCTDTAVRKACISSFRQPKGSRVLPNGSCQGLELSDGGSIYIIGGPDSKNPAIAKMTGKDSNYSYSTLVTTEHSDFMGLREAEGIQLKGDNVYFGVFDKNNHGNGRNCIYSVPKSAF